MKPPDYKREICIRWKPNLTVGGATYEYTKKLRVLLEELSEVLTKKLAREIHIVIIKDTEPTSDHMHHQVHLYLNQPEPEHIVIGGPVMMI